MTVVPSVMRKTLPSVMVGAVAGLLALWPAADAEASAPDYGRAISRLQQAVQQEMADWQITGISIALVDDQQTVYADGFGVAKRDGVFRCGSISKLFNAVAVMQLVEAGKLDLDTPLEQLAPGLGPVNPFPGQAPVTLRQLLCHRSGMFRESPVGGYFDDTEPSLEKTVASIAQGVLVNPPNTQTRYSNIGASVAGRIVELVSGESFQQYQREHVMGPLGMTSSAWNVADVPDGRLVKASMRVADGQGGFVRQTAPVFDLGTIPAGNLYTTAEDLGRFVAMLAAVGKAPGGQILKPETLAQMWTPQLTGAPTGFGVGFMVGKFRNHPVISHGGAVYGYSCSVAYLSDAKLGVVVMSNEDVVNARMDRLSDLALSLMLEAKLGEALPTEPATVEVSVDALADLAGDYESKSSWATVRVKDGRLVGDISGQETKLTPVGPLQFLADSRTNEAVTVKFACDSDGKATGFTLGGQEFKRVAADGAELPAGWQAYLGSYGPSFIPLVVSWRHGHLYAMTENLADYRLTPVTRHVFAFPPGLYTDEYLVFHVDANGVPQRVELSGMILERR